MRPTKILLRLKGGRTVKAFTNVRDRRQPYPRQLHLGYFSIDDRVEEVKDNLFRVLVEKWPRKQKPKAIDWEDAEAKLAKLRLALRGHDVPALERERSFVLVPPPVKPAAPPQLEELKLPPPPDAPTAPPQLEELRLPPPDAPVAPPQLEELELAPPDAPALIAPDEFSFKEALLESSPYLHSLAARLTGNRDAKDLVQATFVRALGAQHRFRQGTNFRAWAMTIMTNVYYDTARRQRREDTHFDTTNRQYEDVNDEREPAGVPSSDSRQLHEIELSRLEEAYRALPAAQRVVHILVYYYGFTDEDIAATLGITKSTSRTLVYRANLFLRKAMGGAIERKQ